MFFLLHFTNCNVHSWQHLTIYISAKSVRNVEGQRQGTSLQVRLFLTINLKILLQTMVLFEILKKTETTFYHGNAVAKCLPSSTSW